MHTGKNRRQAVIRGVPLLAAVYSVLGGAVSFLGWAIDLPRLADWNNSGITMKANAALCSMFAGSALLNLLLAPHRKLLIRILGTIVCAIGALTLAQHLTGIDLGLDTLVFHEPAGTVATSAPGRMGPTASTAFTLIGIALLLATNYSTRRLSGWIALWVMALSTLPLVGYWYGASQLFSLAKTTAIALQTATMIAALAIGVVFSIREWGIAKLIESDDGGGLMFRRLALPLIAIAFILGWLRIAGQEAGIYDTAFGTSLRTIVEIALFVALLWWTANGIRKAEEQVREADRRKDEFLAILSHELRNPLAPIRNAVEILKTEGPANPRLLEARDMIDRQVAHMVRLIDDLLDVNRIAKNKIDLHMNVIDLCTLVKQSAEVARSMIANKNQNLHIDIPETPVFVNADSVRLSQVLNNLINNASKFSDVGQNIWLAVGNSGDSAEIVVRDDGTGIPKDQINSIFAMFSQVAKPAGELKDGLGIGLTLAKQLIELHGGNLDAASDGVGKGSEFTIRLPLSEARARSTEISQPAKSVESQSLLHTILVVDDNVDSAESLSLLMEFAGHETFMAHDGRDAIAKAGTLKPDVILLDIGLPVVDGYGVCRSIRSEPWGKDVLIIALTGWGQDEDRQKSKDAGFDAHMVKPVDPADLLKLLAELKGRAPSSKASAASEK